MTPKDQYQDRLNRVAVALQRHWNESVAIMMASETTDMPEEDKLKALQEMDVLWAQKIVDDIAPYKPLIEI